MKIILKRNLGLWRKFVFVVVAIISSCKKTTPEMTISSPNGNITFSMELDSVGTPFYKAEQSGEIIIKSSKLGFKLNGQKNLENDFSVLSVENETYDETWETVWGQFAHYRNHYNQLRVILKENKESQRLLAVTARIFDDGIGFRYEFPEQPTLDSLLIADELTEFCFANDGTAWHTEADFDTYELGYQKTSLSEMEGANTPFTILTDKGTYLSLHEADLTDYAGMTVMKKAGQTLTFEAELAPWPDGLKVKAKAPFKTPWRTIQIVENPGKLITSGLLLNLNEPNTLNDVSWIEPMKYIGIWWSLHQGVETWTMGPTHGATTQNMKKHIDFAAKHNIRGVLAEGWNKGWKNWGGNNVFDFTSPYVDFDLDSITNYANKKGIAIISHHETGGNVSSYEKNLEKAFEQLEKYKIHSVKLGYAGPIIPEGHQHHNQYMVRHHQKVLELAAKHKVMINAHEGIKPTGKERTYPNNMTGEMARGMEWNGWSHEIDPEHTLILPFTRLLAGPMDYTPGIFDLKYESYDDKRRKWHPSRGDITSMRVKTTLAKQLALMVILYSPMQMASDMIEVYENHPAFQFVEDLQMDFDETEVIEAAIGEFIAIARRTGEKWFVGAATDSTSRNIDVPLHFLTKGIPYKATIYEDAPETNLESNPGAYRIREVKVDHNSIITSELKESGGLAISIEPIY